MILSLSENCAEVGEEKENGREWVRLKNMASVYKDRIMKCTKSWLLTGGQGNELGNNKGGKSD
jgi:hypothetical protein